MFERDYLVKLFQEFGAAIRLSLEKEEEKDPAAASGLLEAAIGNATDIDGATLLSLSPESIAAVLQVSGTDPRVIEFVARSLLLDSRYLQEAEDNEMALLRRQQAFALAKAYGIPFSDESITSKELDELFERNQKL